MTTHPAVTVWLVVAGLLAPRVQSAQQLPVPITVVADSVRRDSTPAVLVGKVVDSAGVGLSGAQVSLGRPERMHVITDDSGEFRITGLPPGSNLFDVRRLGFSAASFIAMLKAGKTHRATFALSSMAQQLPLVAVSDTALKSHWLDQFEHRRSHSQGTFITREQIAKSTARTGTDVVRSIPGIRTTTNKYGQAQVIMVRGIKGGRQCTPQMFVHNVPYSGTLEDFQADDIEALEVYLGISEVPEELDKDGRGYCGVIVVWTRDPRKPPI
jgi:hypothetical protein